METLFFLGSMALGIACMATVAELVNMWLGLDDE